MTLAACPIHTVDNFGVGLGRPEHLFLFQIKDLQLALEVAKGEAGVGGGTCCEGACLDASFIFDGRDDFELPLSELRDLDESCGLGALPADHELAGVGDPLGVVGGVVD